MIDSRIRAIYYSMLKSDASFLDAEAVIAWNNAYVECPVVVAERAIFSEIRTTIIKQLIISLKNNF